MYNEELSYPICPGCGTASAVRITKELHGYNVELWSYASHLGHMKLRTRATFTHLGARFLGWRWGREIKRENAICVSTESNEDVNSTRPDGSGTTES